MSEEEEITAPVERKTSGASQAPIRPLWSHETKRDLCYSCLHQNSQLSNVRGRDFGRHV